MHRGLRQLPPLPLVPNASSIAQSVKTLNVPAHKHRASVPVLPDPPGKRGRSHTVGSDPAETESTGRRPPGLDLQHRVQVGRVGFGCRRVFKQK